jgi:ubiquinone/menaquinone biosynthesis C-methylase UbiE
MAEDVARQYATLDPLQIRMRTHELYEERRVDLDALCLDALALAGDEAILDAGCGPGRFLGQLAEGGHRGRLVGLDQSETMVAEVAKLAAVHPRLEPYRGDVQALPFPDGSFDRAIARHMLYHVPDIPVALSELRRVLRPNGLLLVTTNSGRSLPRILELIEDMLAAFDLPGWERPDARFSIENAAAFLESAGFEVEARIIDNALLFHDPAPIAAYAASMLPSFDIHPGSPQHAEMHAWLTAEAGVRLETLGGEWRDEKRTGVFVGSVGRSL